MARRSAYTPLTVAMNGRRVGELVRETSGAVAFAYGDEWLAWGSAFAVSLSLPLRKQRYQGEQVLAVFDNLLPDETAVRTRLAERLGAVGVDAFSLLAVIGRDCVGALQFLPQGEMPAPPGPPEGVPMSEEEVGRLVEGLAIAPLGLQQEDDFRISLAGAQEKTALLRRDGQWFRPHGVTPTTHILKPQIGMVQGVDLSRSVENEYLCLKLAGAFGLPSAGVEIADFSGTRVLVVERFDRLWTQDGRLLRLPQEDCCQALGVPSTRKYEASGGPSPKDILDLLGGSDDPLGDRQRFLKALALFWLLGATDGHAKNFSLQLRPGGFSLAPLYDIVSLQPAVDAGQIDWGRFKLSMAVGQKRHYVMRSILPRHVVQTGKLGGLRGRFGIAVLRELADAAEGALAGVVQGLPADFPAAVADPIVAAVQGRLGQVRRYLSEDAEADYT